MQWICHLPPGLNGKVGLIQQAMTRKAVNGTSTQIYVLHVPLHVANCLVPHGLTGRLKPSLQLPKAGR